MGPTEGRLCLKQIICWILLLILTAGFVGATEEPEEETPEKESRWSKFVDDEDHSLDLSEWLQSSYGFLPVPLILTEPAIGVGLGAALAFFHDFNTPKEHRGTDRAKDYADLPPSMSAVVGAYTTNESWFAALGHEGSYRQERVRLE